MIFVTVGLHGEGFNRLVEMMEEIAAKTEDKVIIQIGRSNYVPRHAEFFRFREKKGMGDLYSSAEIIVTHGGVGSIMSALTYGKPVIVVPRLSDQGEHKDDHQLDIMTTFSKLGYILAAYNCTELEKAIYAIKNGEKKLRRYNFGLERQSMIDFLRLYLHNLERQKLSNLTKA